MVKIGNCNKNMSKMRKLIEEENIDPEDFSRTASIHIAAANTNATTLTTEININAQDKIIIATILLTFWLLMSRLDYLLTSWLFMSQLMTPWLLGWPYLSLFTSLVYY